MQSKRMNKGFTLIELVFVIVILGILAAFAVPRFVDLTSQARIASLEGLKGSLQSSAALAHAQALADDQSKGSDITVEGVTITMDSTNANDYPTADTGGIEDMLQDTSGFTSSSPDATTFILAPEDIGTGNNCEVTYTLPGVDTEAPSVSLISSNC